MASSLTALIEYSLKQPTLSAEEERSAAKSKDFDLLVRSHMRLAIRIAYRYRGYGLPVEDLISEAVSGLLKAAERFDPDNAEGARFGTYAQFWVRAAITEFVMYSASMVKRGTTAADKKLFFKGASIDDCDAEKVAERLGVRVEDVETARKRRGHDHSLNTPVNADDDGELEWQDILADTTPNAEETLGDKQEQSQMRAQIERGLAVLNDREREILLARYVNEPPVTLRDLAQRHSISAERVRQIEQRALEKIRDTLDYEHAA